MPTWLIVEDEPDIQTMIQAMFQTWGVNGLAFSDGLDALKWIEACEASRVAIPQRPDLALIDIRLPGVSGLEVSARLRNSKQLGHSAILLMTAYRLAESQLETVMRASQADRLIYKPLPMIEPFHRLLNEMIEARHLNRGD